MRTFTVMKKKKNHSRNVAYICLNENVISGETQILGLYQTAYGHNQKHECSKIQELSGAT